MIKILHLSDLHVHTSAKNNAETVKRLSYIRVHYPDHNRIITGDVTDDGKEVQYIRAMQQLLSGTCYICPGNHDYGFAGNFYDKKRALRFDEYLPQARKYMGLLAKPVIEVVKSDETTVVLVGLNSNLRTRNPFDFACGRIGIMQRWWLKRTLSQARRKYPNCVRIVYLHHHPFDRGPWTGLKDSRKLIKCLSMQCELVLFGHKHKAEIFESTAPYMVAAGKLSECDDVTEITINGRAVELNQVPVI